MAIVIVNVIVNVIDSYW